MKQPILAITAGEPAGIGPDVIIQWAQTPRAFPTIIFCDPNLLQARARQLQLPLQVVPVTLDTIPPHAPAQTLYVYPIALAAPCTAGVLDARNAAYVVKTLAVATQACLQGHCNALITAPVHKGIINEAGIAFSGHTEFLAEKANVDVVMLLASRHLKVALVTTHLPLSQVASHITRDKLTTVLNIVHHSFRQHFGISQPRILVAGLNPHAGEGGHMGREEIDVIVPVMSELQQAGLQLQGPLAADTLFTAQYLDHADVVVAMYHDQGLPVLKYQAFHTAVNVTLGLPFIRTSVDHGTALALAGTGKASSSSFAAAVDYALGVRF